MAPDLRKVTKFEACVFPVEFCCHLGRSSEVPQRTSTEGSKKLFNELHTLYSELHTACHFRVAKARSTKPGRTCSTHGKGQACIKHFSLQTSSNRHFENQCVDEKIMLKHILEKWDCMGLAPDRVQCGRTLAEKAINLRVSQDAGNFLTR
jgi:hypothetical protein